MTEDNETEIDAAELIGDVVEAPEPAPAKRTARVAKTPPAAAKTAAQGMPKRVKILLEENDDIPPTGLPLGHNGTAYVILPGEPVEVPEFLIEILDHAMMAAPVTDPQTKRVIGYRDRLRYPYRRL